MFFKIKDLTGWSCSIGWMRGWVSCQNILGNGSFGVEGSILATDGINYWIGEISGGEINSENLKVNWKLINTNII